MTNRRCQTIGAVEVFGQFLEPEQLLQHFGHLFLARRTVSGNGHLDFLGFIFGDRNLTRESGRHCYPLCAPELEHRLDVLAKKRRLDCYFIWMVCFDEFNRTLENDLEFGVMVVIFGQNQLVQLHEFHLFVDHFDQSETHDGGSGIDAENDAFVCHEVFHRDSQRNAEIHRDFLFLCAVIQIPHKAKQFLVSSAKLLIVGFAFYFIYDQLAHNDKLEWQKFVALFQKNWTIGGIVFILSLSFINRFLEILKWKNLVGSFQNIGVAEASKQVLAALTASIFTPNGIGEYAGKALYFEAAQTKKILFLNLINNGIQMLLSVLFGLFGLLYFNAQFTIITTRTVGIIFAIFCTLLLALFFFKSFTIKGYSLEKLIRKINALPKKIHRKNILLGLLRYLVFSHQYYFLFLAFDVDLPYLMLMSVIASVYFLASSLPTFQFFDFAVKGSVAVYFFSLLGVNEWIVIFISTLMWFLNVVLPVVIGSYYVMKFKTRRA